jgi:hypothetical protein
LGEGKVCLKRSNIVERLAAKYTGIQFPESSAEELYPRSQQQEFLEEEEEGEDTGSDSSAEAGKNSFCLSSKDWNLYREETVEGEEGEPETLYYLKEEEEPTEEEFLAKQKELFGKATPAHNSSMEETVDISHLLLQKSDKPVIVGFCWLSKEITADGRLLIEDALQEGPKKKKKKK